MSETDFEKAYNKAVAQTNIVKVSQSLSQNLDNEKLFHEYIIENVPPAHS